MSDLALGLDAAAGERLMAVLVPRLWITPQAEHVEVSALDVSDTAGLLSAGYRVALRGPAWALRRHQVVALTEPLPPTERMAEPEARLWTRIARILAVEDLEVLTPDAVVRFRRLDTAVTSFLVTVWPRAGL